MEPSTSSNSFDSDDIYDFLKEVWAKNRQVEEEKSREEAELHPERDSEAADAQVEEGDSSRRPKTTANQKALKVTCELLRVFVSDGESFFGFK